MFGLLQINLFRISGAEADTSSLIALGGWLRVQGVQGSATGHGQPCLASKPPCLGLVGACLGQPTAMNKPGTRPCLGGAFQINEIEAGHLTWGDFGVWFSPTRCQTMP